jgi:hypothetical protein
MCTVRSVIDPYKCAYMRGHAGRKQIKNQKKKKERKKESRTRNAHIIDSPLDLVREHPIHRRYNLHWHVNQAFTEHKAYVIFVASVRVVWTWEKSLERSMERGVGSGFE